MKKILHILLLGCLLPTLSFSQGFKIVGTELRDANGRNFIMKGFSVPTSWFATDVNNNIANMRRLTNANCLRIVVNTSNSDAIWQTSVRNCIANNIIPMVELHDVTGSNDPARLNAMAQFWASKAAFFKRPEIARYILINIANEWGDWYMSANQQGVQRVSWRDTYINCVRTLRNAGINTTLVIDAPGYGQDNKAQTLLLYAKDVQAADTQKNCLFSIHMYCEWQVGGNSSITTHLAAVKNAGIPLIVGEFGYQHDEGGSTCDINETQLLSTCQSNGIGWLAWSWKGNGTPVQYLDMSADWAGNNLSAWGRTVVSGANGTKTAVTASVFTITGTDNAEMIKSFNISPNPTSETVNISIPEGISEIGELSIYDNLGTKILSHNLNSREITLNLSSLNAGLYFVKLADGSNTLTKKLIIK